ncbi:hypothetical protein SBRCBS47491_002347 [Sporothrix bragantina]|uniref:Tho complex subunit 7 n=1 Tax=Sporothrix bragantina TaxID=671064 RepID=A0ABP0B627_9PEZI
MAYQLLDPREEEELFRSRLLNVEEKPFKRITKRLATLNRVVASAGVQQEQTPPPEGEGDDSAQNATEREEKAQKDRADALAEIAQLREDVTLDFAAFDASIARLQFLAAANARERARYADHRVTIADTCHNVRDDVLVGLRSQLESARATLQQRQVFDALADRITSSKTLWPRPEQQATIDKLEDECRQLQRESEAYTATWRERKQQFARIMDESMRLRRLIRDEKEEVERREGMDDEEAPAASATATGTAGAASQTAAAGATAGDKTPLSVAGATLNVTAPDTNEANSPAPTEADDSGGRSLRPETAVVTAAGSREVTPAPSIVVDTPAATANGGDDGDDVDMVEVDETEGAATATQETQDEEATPSTAALTPAVDTPAETENMDTT